MYEAGGDPRLKLDDRANLDLVLSRIGPVLLGVEGCRVETVLDRAAAGGAGSTEACWDAAKGFGVTQAQAGAFRRALRVAATNGTVTVVVGPKVWVQEVPAAGVRSLPGFLDGLWKRLPLLGLFEHEGGLGYLLDPGRLEACARQAR